MTEERWFLTMHTVFNVILLVIIITFSILAWKVYRQAELLQETLEKQGQGRQMTLQRDCGEDKCPRKITYCGEDKWGTKV